MLPRLEQHTPDDALLHLEGCAGCGKLGLYYVVRNERVERLRLAWAECFDETRHGRTTDCRSDGEEGGGESVKTKDAERPPSRSFLSKDRLIKTLPYLFKSGRAHSDPTCRIVRGIPTTPGIRLAANYSGSC